MKNNDEDKPIYVLHGEIKTPPMSRGARLETGYLLRKLQQGETLSMPQSRPMPQIGARVHELRITDTDKIWRIIYRLDDGAIVILEIFAKKTQETPKQIIEICKKRISHYDLE